MSKWIALRHTLEGDDGKISIKRILVYWFTILATINALSIKAIVWIAVTKNINCDTTDIAFLEKLISLQLILCGMVLLLLGIVSMQQIIQFKNGPGGPPPDDKHNDA